MFQKTKSCLHFRPIADDILCDLSKMLKFITHPHLYNYSFALKLRTCDYVSDLHILTSLITYNCAWPIVLKPKKPNKNKIWYVNRKFMFWGGGKRNGWWLRSTYRQTLSHCAVFKNINVHEILISKCLIAPLAIKKYMFTFYPVQCKLNVFLEKS